MYLLEFAGEDDPFAAAEATAAATDVRVLAPGIGVAAAVDETRVEGLAFTRRVSEVVARTEDGLDTLCQHLASVPLDRQGTVAVRARNVRGSAAVDTQVAERRLGQVLVDRGFAVDLSDPDHTLIALFAGDLGTLGWAVETSTRDYGDRAPTDRPFFQPGSMDPLLARAVLNLAHVGHGDRVLDPMCGTGGLLIEAGLLGARPVGIDAQAKMVRGAEQNVAAALDEPPLLVQGDSTTLPLADDSIDAVIFDAPYGRQSKIAGHDLADLVRGALEEARRVADRAVVVADRGYDDPARAAGWTVTNRFARPVHRSLTRYVHVLDPV